MALFRDLLVLIAGIALLISAVDGRAGIQDTDPDDTLHVYFPGDDSEMDVHADQATDVEDIPNEPFPDTFQRCMLACIDPDLCCSCKKSGKTSMMAALVNDMAKECSSSDIAACTRQWTKSVLEPAIVEGGASNCTNTNAISMSVQKCVTSCSGKPFSKPLDPHQPLVHPGVLETEAELTDPPSVDLTDFCEDIRAEGLFCSHYRHDSFTAGRSLCRGGTRCGFHGYKYKWCYVDYKNHWDYCCTGSCGFHQNTPYMWCYSGPKWQYCGNAGNRDIKGRRCLAEYPCGVHRENGKASYFWCQVDVQAHTWERCCEPWNRCRHHHRICYTGFKKGTDEKECVP